LSAEQGDTRSVIWCLVYLGDIARMEGDLAGGKELSERVLALARETADRVVVAMSLHMLGAVAMVEGEYSAARELCEESLALACELGQDQHKGWALQNLGQLAHLQQDDRRAIALHLEGLAHFRKTGVQKGVGLALMGLVQAGGTNWPAVTAARLLGAADALLDGDRAYLDYDHKMVFASCAAATRSRLGEAEFESAWAKGRLLTWDAVSNLLLALPSAEK
jgi:hypothetical protein